VGLDRKAKEDISEVEKQIHKRTDVSSTGLDKKMRMEVNALDYMTERVLFIECEDEK